MRTNVTPLDPVFKDQKSADAAKRQLSDLSKRIDHTLQPVFRSRKIGEDLKMREPKPPLVNQQCVLYNYQCDLCDAEYVGYTSRRGTLGFAVLR